MLRSVKSLGGYAICATDGDIGHVKDVLFDDESWTIRYFVVETGAWLSSRKVLVSAIDVHQPSWAEKILGVSITKNQVKASPNIDTDKPVSRQHESAHLGHYGHSPYWGTNPGLVVTGYPSVEPNPADGYEPQDAFPDIAAVLHRDDDPHLRSCKMVIGYHVHAADGEIGHVKDMLVDDECWTVRYLIVNTSNWWIGHQVLVAPQWIKGISWTAKSVSTDLIRQALKEAPPYDPATQLSRVQEIDIFKHYGRAGYWHIVDRR